MLNNDQTESALPDDRAFWFITSLLFCSAVALRWVRLDLMTFRYDQAEVAFRAMGAFRADFPFTGIVNSMGFENAPGYVWSLLPAFFFSADPRWATAWHGLLASTMIFPLALLGKRYRSDALLWLPAVLAAILPVSVFGGRNLWAQHLLPPVTAWALLALDTAMDDERSWPQRRAAGGFMLAVLAWGISIHFSAAPLCFMAAGFLLVGFRTRLTYLVPALIPAALIFATMVPSGVNWWMRSNNPAPKADYVRDFETILPDPLPWYVRIPDSVVASLSNSSIEPVWGIQDHLSRTVLSVIKCYDLSVLCLLLLSAGYAFFWIFRRKSQSTADSWRKFSVVLVSCVVIPAVTAGFFVERVNASYFLGTLPVGWLLPLLLPSFGNRVRRYTIPIVISVFAGGLLIYGILMASIAKHQLVSGPYYIPYGMQAKTIAYINVNKVGLGSLNHLSGGWFQRSYDYIHKYGRSEAGPMVLNGQAFALIEDKNLWPEKPEKLKIFWNENPAQFGDVGVLVFQAQDAAERFANRYYGSGNT